MIVVRRGGVALYGVRHGKARQGKGRTVKGKGTGRGSVCAASVVVSGSGKACAVKAFSPFPRPTCLLSLQS